METIWKLERQVCAFGRPWVPKESIPRPRHKPYSDHVAAENSTEAPPARPIGRPFKPGQSGNPGGRPKGL